MKYGLRIGMIEIRNDAGRKVAVEPLAFTVEAATHGQAARILRDALQEALNVGIGVLQARAQARVQAQVAETADKAREEAPTQGAG